MRDHFDILIKKAETKLSVDRTKLSDEMQDFIFEYGLKQKLNDAGSSIVIKNGGTAADALASAKDMLAALLDGSARRKREGRDAVEVEAERLALIRVKQSAAFKGKSAKEQLEAARRYAPNFRAQAEKNVAEVESLPQLPDDLLAS